MPHDEGDPHGMNYATAGCTGLPHERTSLRLVPRYEDQEHRVGPGPRNEPLPPRVGSGKTDGAFDRPFGRRTTGPLPPSDGIYESCDPMLDAAKPALRHKTSAERKGEPIHSGVLKYFPDAIAAVSRVSLAGNQKHNPGQPLHWARGKSTDQLDCQARHSLTTEVIDPETGEVEAAAMVWRGLAELQLIEERRLRAKGIMPYSGVVS